ncbi:uroporphyrinogen decarboxylase family protein [Clostridium sp. MT-14]|uniref:Uroporphyrinogen-III decarboxylase n=1 Tax=Clostridium aromativorans TaxID=2836848 RepID=A0ABS8N7V4_9CLOT|nr:uroporphyrinogen decarboxylase family protein [Clostridium aromativorans]MCC9295873.1 uroporphyrinogen-III decarboxylase [Clostridium aromativorans]CAB1244946.1 Methylcobalamin:coenzyme M methyltransferase [Clostridiaceae bacterium BL-3]
MKSNQELYNERLNRLKKALALEKTDRTPVILMMDGFCAKHMGVKMSEFCKSIKISNKVILNSLKAFGEVDGVNSSYAAGPIFPLVFMSKVRLPGRELPDDMLWQLDEAEMMTVKDYDVILNKGWNDFKQDYLKNRLQVDVDGITSDLLYASQADKNIEDSGYVVYSPFVTLTANEALGGGRSLSKFMMDLYRMPDKVEAVLQVIQKENMDELRKQMRAVKPTVVFLSPARGASEFFSPKLWERFVWKYIKGAADIIIEEGAVCDIHCDGNWERDLDYFKDFPKGKIVFETDGVTDIYKIKDKLGNRECIKGDVPAGKLVLGTSDEVYDYASRLVKDMGDGFILSSGCSIPPNAKPENVKAMISAATGK